MLKVLLAISFSCILFTLHSQDRCGTVEYEKLRSLRNPNRESINQFESWIKDKLIKKSQAIKSQRTESVSYQIPVVVHVIHNGEAVGTGTNISDAQILSQIPVLNNDFQRLNADSVNTPAEFVSSAGKFPVTFVMAKQDPDGLATNGIVRVKGSQSSWAIEDNYTLKALSYWPAEQYLNIWVVNLSGGLLGYTQLPVSSTLQGLADSSNDRLTDGVVIDYSAYGIGSGFNLQSKYDLGRTTTHEVGHFFGLRHMWGDVNSCDPTVSTDYVGDTPIQNTDYNGLCPSSAQTECGVHSMYDNYMNYTDDACMNIYSKGQAARMDVIINNSPRRVSLLTSLGLQPPAPVANDLGIKSISNPGSTTCSGSLVPSLVIRNYGTNTITNAQIQFLINGILTETKTLSTLNLIPNSETAISFSSVSVSAGATYNFSFKILQTNGGTDGKASNNSQSITTQIPVSAPLPLQEPFTTIPSGKIAPAGWQVANPDGLTTWSNISLTGSNHAMYLNFYDYDQQGTPDLLITPVLDLTTSTVASLNFEYAYAPYQGGSTDGLRVLVSTVCDFNALPVVVFNKSGSALATTTATGSPFTPTSSSQWATSFISLNQFIGQKIQIAFEGINGYGNNLYLDNVLVTNAAVTGFILNGIVKPSPVSCNSTVAPVISVTNRGNVTINSFTADVYVNNKLTVQQFSGVQLAVGSTSDFTLASANFLPGENSLSVALKNPNGLALAPASDDSVHTTLVINSAADIIPLRENFDDNFVDRWVTTNPQSGIVWHTAATNKSNSMLFPAFGNTNLGQQAWLVSPVLDFSKAQAASVNFQTSYAFSSMGYETLQVFSSSDCGVTFDSLLFNSSGELLSNTNSNAAWIPSDDTQWTKININLDNVAGKENIRLAFVATNGNGNNLYIDNIEFFMDDVQPHPTIESQYYVYGGAGSPVKVTFNLPERGLVRMQVYDMLGHVVSDNLLPDTLNQTYTIDFPQESRGLYVVRVQTATSIGATKVLMGF
jgi:hypothetical protein